MYPNSPQNYNQNSYPNSPQNYNPNPYPNSSQNYGQNTYPSGNPQSGYTPGGTNHRPAEWKTWFKVVLYILAGLSILSTILVLISMVTGSSSLFAFGSSLGKVFMLFVYFVSIAIFIVLGAGLVLMILHKKIGWYLAIGASGINALLTLFSLAMTLITLFAAFGMLIRFPTEITLYLFVLLEIFELLLHLIYILAPVALWYLVSKRKVTVNGGNPFDEPDKPAPTFTRTY